MSRPQKYTDEQLSEILRQARSELTEDLNPYLLEKHTGISKAVWRSRMAEQIEQLNSSFNNPYEDSHGLGLSYTENVLSIYENNKHNERLLLARLNAYDIFVNNMLRIATEVQPLQIALQETTQSLNSKIRELEEKAQTLKIERDHFEKEYLESIGQSTFRQQYRTKKTTEPISMAKVDNVSKIDFIGRNSDMFE